MFKFELSEAIAIVVLEALAGLPLHKSFDAFVAIRSQMGEQQRIAAEAAAAAAAPPTPPAPPTPSQKDEGGVVRQPNGAATE
jgi:hypothetical protein